MCVVLREKNRSAGCRKEIINAEQWWERWPRNSVSDDVHPPTVSWWTPTVNWWTTSNCIVDFGENFPFVLIFILLPFVVIKNLLFRACLFVSLLKLLIMNSWIHPRIAVTAMDSCQSVCQAFTCERLPVGICSCICLWKSIGDDQYSKQLNRRPLRIRCFLSHSKLWLTKKNGWYANSAFSTPAQLDGHKDTPGLKDWRTTDRLKDTPGKFQKLYVFE